MVLLLAGCGVYSFNPRGKSTVGSIYVAPFENETSEYGLTDRLTEITIDAFIADGSIKVLPETDAEAVLVAVLRRYERAVQQYDENDQVLSYKIILDLDVTLQKTSDQSEIWKDRIPAEGVYDAVEETEEDGQRRAGEWLVDAVLNKTTKSW